MIEPLVFALQAVLAASRCCATAAVRPKQIAAMITTRLNDIATLACERATIAKNRGQVHMKADQRRPSCTRSSQHFVECAAPVERGKKNSMLENRPPAGDKKTGSFADPPRVIACAHSSDSAPEPGWKAWRALTHAEIPASIARPHEKEPQITQCGDAACVRADTARSHTPGRA
jgi:hypothetical protein